MDGLSLHRRISLAAVLLGAALAAWIVTVERMRGMDAGPGTDLGALGWFIGVWVTMMAAMMLPSAAPAVLAFARLRRDPPVLLFILGYLLAWSASGLAAYGLDRALRAWEPSFVAWARYGPWVAGGALVAAGLYQLTPLKAACLRHCRSPLRFLLCGRPGRFGALWLGTGHGGACIGCCAGLMLALFALGVMSVFWMAVVAAAVFVEKALPGGAAFARILALVLVVLGVWVAAAPASVPGLTQPHGMQTQMGTEMP